MNAMILHNVNVTGGCLPIIIRTASMAERSYALCRAVLASFGHPNPQESPFRTQKYLGGVVL